MSLLVAAWAATTLQRQLPQGALGLAQGATGLHKVPRACKGCHRLAHGAMDLHKVPQACKGCHRLAQGATDLHRVIWACTGWYGLPQLFVEDNHSLMGCHHPSIVIVVCLFSLYVYFVSVMVVKVFSCCGSLFLQCPLSDNLIMCLYNTFSICQPMQQLLCNIWGTAIWTQGCEDLSFSYEYWYKQEQV